MSCKRKREENRFSVDTYKNVKGKLKETGRLHYFFHSPSSKLPMRDVFK